jgi:Tfp pilus assembly protein PilF
MFIHRLLPCLALCFAPAALNAQAVPTEATRIGFDELKRGQNAAAIEEIMGNDALSGDDPARNINLAVAYAREGDSTRAQAYFRAALLSESRVDLQTAQGEWVDSRELARQGLRKLARGAFSGEQFASSR